MTPTSRMNQDAGSIYDLKLKKSIWTLKHERTASVHHLLDAPNKGYADQLRYGDPYFMGIILWIDRFSYCAETSYSNTAVA